MLISSFASQPLGLFGLKLRLLPLGLILRLPPPEWLLRLLLLAPSSSQVLFQSVRSAIAMVDSAVMAGRIRDALAVNCEAELKHYRVPLTAIFSENDRLLGTRAAKHFERCCPGGVIEWVRAPHLLLQSSPVAAVQLLRKHGLI